MEARRLIFILVVLSCSVSAAVSVCEHQVNKEGCSRCCKGLSQSDSGTSPSADGEFKDGSCVCPDSELGPKEPLEPEEDPTCRDQTSKDCSECRTEMGCRNCCKGYRIGNLIASTKHEIFEGFKGGKCVCPGGEKIDRANWAGISLVREKYHQVGIFEDSVDKKPTESINSMGVDPYKIEGDAIKSPEIVKDSEDRGEPFFPMSFVSSSNNRMFSMPGYYKNIK